MQSPSEYLAELVEVMQSPSVTVEHHRVSDGIDVSIGTPEWEVIASLRFPAVTRDNVNDCADDVVRTERICVHDGNGFKLFTFCPIHTETGIVAAVWRVIGRHPEIDVAIEQEWLRMCHKSGLMEVAE